MFDKINETFQTKQFEYMKTNKINEKKIKIHI